MPLTPDPGPSILSDDGIPAALVPAARRVSEYRKIYDHDLPESYKDAIAKLEKVEFDKEAPRPSFDRGLKYHPEGLLDNRHKQDMFYAFDSYAVGGLAEYLYRYAGKTSVRLPHERWKLFLDDERAPKKVLPFLIMSMHPDIVKALICGNLTARVHSDSEFKQLVKRLTRPWDTPGVYFNQIFDRGSGDVKTSEGKGLSYDDWQNIYDDIVLYGDVYDPMSLPLAIKVDYAWTPKQADQVVDHSKTPNARRYLENKRQKTLESFLAAVKRQVLKSGAYLDAEAKAQQALSAPFEIGYSHDVANRLTDHLTNFSTNWLWGLLTSVIRVRFGDRFDLSQGQLLYVCDPQHRKLGEALCTVLSSSYYYLMGGNPTIAGGIGHDPPRANRGYRKNIKALLAPGGERYEGYMKAREFNKAIVTLNKDLEEQEKVEPLAEAVARAKVRRQNILEQADRLRKRVEAMKTVAHMQELDGLVRVVNPNTKLKSIEGLPGAAAEQMVDESGEDADTGAAAEDFADDAADDDDDDASEAVEDAGEKAIVGSVEESIADSEDDDIEDFDMESA